MTTLERTAPASYAVGKGRLPVVGHTLAMLRSPFRFFEELQGQADIVAVDLGTVPTLFITEPSLVHTLLTDRERVLDKGRFYDKVRPLAGNGVVLAQGEEHRKQLRMLKPAFHRDTLVHYADVMQGVVEQVTGTWAEGREIAADKEMHAMTLRILADTMFGAGVDKEAVSELIRLLPEVLKGIMVRTVVPDVVDRLPLPVNRRFDQAFADLRAAITRIMQAYRSGGLEDSGDMMSMILAERDPDTGEPLTDEQVCDQIVAVTMAGAETAATALGWTFYELARHPEVEERVASEARTVLGERPFEVADTFRLEYTRLVLQEVLRLRQPILVISRRATRDFVLGGRPIPAGTEMFYSPFGLFRDPTLFPDPHTFDVDRWVRTPMASLPRGAYVPFGGGPRHCVGEQFGWVMMAAVVSGVVRNWRLELPSGFEARPMPWATVNPRSLPMTVRRRTR